MNENFESIQLDKELLSDYVQRLGHGVVKQMFDLYIQQVALYINDIESSLLCDNSQLWQEHCHKMKGAAGSVGLKSLHIRLKEMEKTTMGTSGKAQQLAELKIHNKQAIAAFDDWLSGL
ncbi:Hpt domain-containing protein [Colwellia sp. 6_MG-2023]|uniref:Hpt domain-containing protein n=1 Tax=Colwellia sp. 6_MG-2023 TaxID=3062676 RepID=UPI0026E33B80|nr:Hpt domain-containing protein [Colwellia sp. 6_MG-2023]MDO6486791.1 Hpt domain-containing protein [Colwellia sp. 6_MG-2023]